jgi:hypothetical protein
MIFYDTNREYRSSDELKWDPGEFNDANKIVCEKLTSIKVGLAMKWKKSIFTLDLTNPIDINLIFMCLPNDTATECLMLCSHTT